MNTGASVLRNSATIRTLCVASALLGDQSLKDIAAMRSLTSLDISRNLSLTAEGMRHLRSATALEELFCDQNTKIGDDGIRHIMSLPNLSALSIFEIAFSEEAAEAIAASRSLRSLTLGTQNLSTLIVHAVVKSRSMLHITFPYMCKFFSPSFWGVAEELSKNTTLATVSLCEALTTPTFLEWCKMTNLVSMHLSYDKFLPDLTLANLEELSRNISCASFKPFTPGFEEIVQRNRKEHLKRREVLLRLLQMLAVDPDLSLSRSGKSVSWWKVPREVREKILLYALEDDRTARLMGKHWLQVRREWEEKSREE
jgi:hypothetical protein